MQNHLPADPPLVRVYDALEYLGLAVAFPRMENGIIKAVVRQGYELAISETFVSVCTERRLQTHIMELIRRGGAWND